MKRAVYIIFWVITGGAALSFVARVGWPLELFVHFRVQYFLLLALAVPLLIYRRHFALAAFAGASALIVALALFPRGNDWRAIDLNPTASAPGVTRATVMAFNMFDQSRAFDATARFARINEADVLVLTEIPNARRKDLRVVFADYPHWAGASDDSDAQWASAVILSRFPIVHSERIPVAGEARDFTTAKVCPATRANGVPACLSVVAAHPPAPASSRATRERDSILEAAAERAGRAEGPAVFLGDFNATPWSPVMRDISAIHDLTRADCGGRLRPTWITRVPGIGLPIDHILTNDRVGVEQCAVGRFLYSDHYPVIAQIQWRTI